jgi:hypothetical protein
LQTQVGITFIFVTHDQEEALSMSDRIVTAASTGTSTTTFVAASRLENQMAQMFPGLSSLGDNFGKHTLAAKLQEGFTVIAARAADDAVPGNPGLAAVRPEAVTLELDVPDQAINAVHGRLAGISHLGDLIQYVVITASGREMLSRQPRHEAPRLIRADVWCRWETDRCSLRGDQSTVVIADPRCEPRAHRTTSHPSRRPQWPMTRFASGAACQCSTTGHRPHAAPAARHGRRGPRGPRRRTGSARGAAATTAAEAREERVAAPGR